MVETRVVVTGMGICAPNATELKAFSDAIRHGVSGVRFDPQLASLGFSCQLSARPEIGMQRLEKYFSPLELKSMDSSGIAYGVIAALDAWDDAGLAIADQLEPDWDSGAVFGTGTSGVDKFRWAIGLIDQQQIRRLGSSVVGQTMASGASAVISGKLGLGNRVGTNSSACATGTESILMAYEHVKAGRAKRMLAGSTSDSGPYIWGGFDAMKVCTFKSNGHPGLASRPMSESAGGFVPGSGAGAMVLESLESALQRNARIYAEVLGGHVNSGGQRGGGTMTAPNPASVQRCIRLAIESSGIASGDIDLVNGHLTATSKDTMEIRNWTLALGRGGADFPYINSIKGMIGHCLSAAGSIECVASVLQLHQGFVFPNLNCQDLSSSISALVDPERIPQQLIEGQFDVLAKASFGFGDVNACLILKKYKNG